MKKTKTKKITRALIFRVNITLISALMVSLLAHLVVANHAAIQRTEISGYMEHYNQLQIAKQKLAVAVAELQSSERLSEESKRMNLVKAETIYYISGKGSVALRK